MTIAWIIMGKNHKPVSSIAAEHCRLPIYSKRRIAKSYANVIGNGAYIERVMVRPTPLPVSFMKGKSAVQKQKKSNGKRNREV